MDTKKKTSVKHLISTRQHLPRNRNNSELPNLMTILQCESHPMCSVSGQWEDLGTFDSNDVQTTNTRPKMAPCYLEMIHVKKILSIEYHHKISEPLAECLALLDYVRQPNVVALASVVAAVRSTVNHIFNGSSRTYTCTS